MEDAMQILNGLSPTRNATSALFFAVRVVFIKKTEVHQK
jgi:hypothetical protein